MVKFIALVWRCRQSNYFVLCGRCNLDRRNTCRCCAVAISLHCDCIFFLLKNRFHCHRICRHGELIIVNGDITGNNLPLLEFVTLVWRCRQSNYLVFCGRYRICRGCAVAVVLNIDCISLLFLHKQGEGCCKFRISISLSATVICVSDFRCVIINLQHISTIFLFDRSIGPLCHPIYIKTCRQIRKIKFPISSNLNRILVTITAQPV